MIRSLVHQTYRKPHRLPFSMCFGDDVCQDLGAEALTLVARLDLNLADPDLSVVSMALQHANCLAINDDDGYVPLFQAILKLPLVTVLIPSSERRVEELSIGVAPQALEP